MTNEIKRKYAKLLIEVGVNLQKGQKLQICAEPYHWDFVVLLTEVAYQHGASLVVTECVDARIYEARINHSDSEYLELSPSWMTKKYDSMVNEEWANINFFGSRFPDMMGGLDSSKTSRQQKAARLISKPLSDGCGAAKISWCGAALPTPEWAAKVYKEASSEQLVERLWGDMTNILRLDQEDPSAFWRQHGLEIKSRCEKLESLKIDSLRFVGAGTDLTVKCLPNAKWIGGGVFIDGKEPFIPNLPTEESFSTPDFRGTEGIAKVVRPVTVLGKPVEGAWFRFEQGKVVEYGADVNQSALDSYFEMCPQASYLGEVALVDGASPIYQSGHVFHCILYDENASCHVALGSGYPMGVDGGLEMTKDELLELGSNVSLVHTDFMIGSPEVEVIATTSTGEEIKVISNGTFVI